MSQRIHRESVSGMNVGFQSVSAVMNHVENGRLRAYRDDGLFSRLMCFLNAVRLSKVLGLEKPFLLWECGSISGNSVHGYRKDFSEVFEAGEEFEVCRVDGAPDTGRVFTWDFVVLLEGESFEEVFQELGKLARKIRLKSMIEDGPLQRDLGIHCRAGDVEGHVEWSLRKGYPLSLWKVFFRILGEGDHSKHYYVASNSVEYIDAAKNNLGEHCDTFSDIGTCLKSSECNLRRDFLDNLEFSNCRRIVGSGYSSFVMFAAVRGGNVPESPLDWLSPEIREAFLEITDLWKCAYLSDVSYLVGSTTRGRVTAERLAKEGYPVHLDEDERWSNSFCMRLLRLMNRLWFRFRMRVEKEGVFGLIWQRFLRISKW